MAAGPAPSEIEDSSKNICSIGAEEEEEDPDSLLELTSHNPTRDALAEGILTLLSPTIKTLDEGVLATKRSQEDLAEQISLLTEQLQLIAAEQTCPIDLTGYVARLGDIKGKINVISSVLHNAQDRLTKVHEQATKEAARRRPLIEPAPVITTSSTSSPSLDTPPKESIEHSGSPTSPESQPQGTPSSSKDPLSDLS